ncbi:MAG: NAD(P)/FAD-dependent oxidoreductase [Oceanospirillaceae bacterium]|nr:NAD(P)/FAD-dependent oxidoreductase [Oceanospirillaceae bacterium]MCP5335528.1 NAD(P)/FAD-dependent oxidoreductase [Oceanospirillaceae bacterium]MCP5349999.1 NAD(P)/FAD-dependent oxidoreductase [Oceanospirillaceae bacterium]
MADFDVQCVVIGAGVIGLAVARQLVRHFPDMLILEQHAQPGTETSSRNSEVIHAGIYYPSGSLKARLCVEGKHLLREYCRQQGITYRDTGKLLVASTPNETLKLRQLAQQAEENGVLDLQHLSQSELSNLEPELNACAGVLSPSTGIIDSHALLQQLLHDAQQKGATLVCHTRITGISPRKGGGYCLQFSGQGDTGQLNCEYLINAGGLHSSQLLASSGHASPHTWWCQGRYFSLQGKSPFRHLIYPMPQQAGLGIHATLNLDNQLRFGPDTHYTQQLDYRVDAELQPLFAEAIRRYYPNLDPSRLVPDYSGIRPKLQGPRDKFADFTLIRHAKSLHLLGIESPGLTSCLAIAALAERTLLQL